MSIESKEINDIYTLYQNLYEKNTRLDKSKYDLNKLQGGLSRDEYNNLSSSERNQLNRALKVQSLQNKAKEVGLKKGEGPVTVSSVNDEGKPKRVDNQSDNTSSNAKGNPIGGNNEGGPKGNSISSSDEKKPTASGSVEVDGKKLMNKLKSDSSTTKKIPGEFPGTRKEFDAKYGSDKKVTPPAPKLDRESGTPPNRTAPKLDRDEVKSSSSNSSSDVGSDGLSSKNKKNTTKTVNKVNSRGRVTGTKEVRVQSQQSDGGTPIRNSRGRVTGTTKPTDAEGKSFPSTAEIRAKAKADGGSGLSNIPSKEGNAVINKKPLNPDFGKKPVIQKDTAVKPEISARQKWLDKTRNSPAAKGGLSDDQRWAARQKHVKFQKDNNRGPFRDPNKKAGGRKFNPSNKITSVMDMESYDAYDLVLDYLLETNQVDTIEEANYVMIQMDQSTIQGIVNEYA